MGGRTTEGVEKWKGRNKRRTDGTGRKVAKYVGRRRKDAGREVARTD
jgi:hypothetical protein